MTDVRAKREERLGRRGWSVRGRQARAAYILLLPALLFYLLVWAAPLVRTIQIMFYRWNFLTPPVFVGLQNFRVVFADPHFWLALANTFAFALIAVPVGLFLSFVLALGVFHLSHGKAFYRTVFFATSLTPPVIASIIFKFWFNPEVGLINDFLYSLGITGPPWLSDQYWGMTAVIIVSVWAGLGYNMVVYLAGLSEVDPSLYEAARIDGAGFWQAVRYVTVPLIQPTVLFTTVIGFIGGLQVFAQVLIITNGGPARETETALLYIYREAFDYQDVGGATILAFVLFCFILVVTLFWMKILDRGTSV